MSLRLDWCDHKAAEYACKTWHYSKCIPKSKLVKVGVWEGGQFIGVVIFGYGATAGLGAPYNLTMQQCCELVRIALKTHTAPVSRIIAIALKFLKMRCPELRLVVSFADQTQGHHGGIYQATNWVYAGVTPSAIFFRDPHGKLWHPRRASRTPNPQKQLVTKAWKEERQSGKYRYLMPLDKEMREQVLKLAKPYPKRSKGLAPVQQEEGGSTPT